jgi:hypothetical protein
MSYQDHVGFGVLACRDAIRDVELMARRISEAMMELVKTTVG